METYSDTQSGYGRHATERTSNWRQLGSGQAKMDRLKELIDQFVFVLPFGLWAMLGWVARSLQTGWLGWKNTFIQMLLMFILGATIGLLLAETGINEFVKCGICSCVGMSGGKIMQDLITWTRRRLEKTITGDDKHGPNDTMED